MNLLDDSNCIRGYVELTFQGVLLTFYCYSESKRMGQMRGAYET